MRLKIYPASLLEIHIKQERAKFITLLQPGDFKSSEGRERQVGSSNLLGPTKKQRSP